MLTEPEATLTRRFGPLRRIKENAYCLIYRAGDAATPSIVKQYKGADASLARQEAEALDFYHEIARDDPDLTDSRCLEFDADANLLQIGFVEGLTFTRLLYRARRCERARRQAVHAMGVLGRLMRQLNQRTRIANGATTPFMYEYIQHCSKRLSGFPILGRALFRNARAEADELWRDLQACGVEPSFIHGDLVFRNIHVDDDGRVGLIDFANALPDSHTLNDLYNLRLALDNMWLPRAFRRELWAAFEAGLAPLTFPEAAHRFYFEYHRRRWLMLKIGSRNPWWWTQAARGLATFARPFPQERPDPSRERPQAPRPSG